MTADQATYAAILALKDDVYHRPETERTRMANGHHPTHGRSRRATSANQPEAALVYNVQHMAADTGRTGLHPVDVIFWVACLGGAFLLLLSATT